jgi:Tfp pilus assembly protein PilF
VPPASEAQHAAPAHNNLGIALAASQDLGGAVAGYRRALALDPKLAQAHFNLGWVLQSQGRFAESLKCFRRGHALGASILTAPSASNRVRS